LTKKFIYSDPEPNSMRFLKAVFGKKARRHWCLNFSEVSCMRRADLLPPLPPVNKIKYCDNAKLDLQER
jgi:hypothetical protein